MEQMALIEFVNMESSSNATTNKQINNSDSLGANLTAKILQTSLISVLMAKCVYFGGKLFSLSCKLKFAYTFLPSNPPPSEKHSEKSIRYKEHIRNL